MGAPAPARVTTRKSPFVSRHIDNSNTSSLGALQVGSLERFRITDGMLIAALCALVGYFVYGSLGVFFGIVSGGTLRLGYILKTRYSHLKGHSGQS